MNFLKQKHYLAGKMNHIFLRFSFMNFLKQKRYLADHLLLTKIFKDSLLAPKVRCQVF